MDLAQDGQVLYVTSVDLSLRGGPGINEREFVLSLGQRLGGRAHFVVPQPGDRTVAEELVAYDVTYTRAWVQNPLSYMRHLIDKSRRVDALLHRQHYDLLIFRLSLFPIVELLLPRINPSAPPYVIKTQGESLSLNIDTQGGRHGPGFLRRAVTLLDKPILKNVVTGALAVDACTQQLVDLHAGAFGLENDLIRWIPNAANTHRFSPMEREQARSETGLGHLDPIIGFVGSKPWVRGGRQMIDVLPRLAQRFPSVGAVIVGDGPGMDGLRERASALGVLERCVFPGLVAYERVPWFINAFDVGISFDDPKRFDVVGNSSQKIRQYVACGKPVISAAGANSFLTEEGLGSLIDSRDPDSLFDTVCHWLSLTESLRKSHADKAAAYARRHLSMESSLTDRLDFWNSRLVQQGGVGGCTARERLVSSRHWRI
jgi:glycosyltransferase involved in cell wall biosynthesis